MIKTFVGLSLIHFGISQPYNYGFPSYMGDSAQPLFKFESQGPTAYPKYQFEYEVKDDHTGDIKQQSEERHGNVVKGQYSFMEPDGTMRKVQYSDDGHSGFNAIVIRSGHAVHPPTKLAIPVALKPSAYLH